jgi:hypothetical protein
MSHPNEVVHITKYHDDAAPVHPEAAPVKHTAAELEAIHKHEQESAKVHAHLPDGSIIPEVKFCFVFPTLDHKGRIVPLHGHDSHNHHHQETHELLQYFSKPNDIVKGGFFVTAEEKSWSNETTIDEPWMIESYFKALIPILKKKATSGVAYPFWPKAAKGDDAVEAKVNMHLVPGHETALELAHEDHHCCIKVSTRTMKVSLKHFVQSMVSEAEDLLKFMAKLNPAVLGEATMKKFPNPDRLGGYLDEIKTLI